MRIRKILLVFVFLLILNNSVSALGVGPVLVYKVYESGESDDVMLHVFNNENQSLALAVSARGSLADNIIFDKTRIYLDKGEYSADLRYTVTYPDDLAPGAHLTDIVVREIQPEDESTVIAAQSVVSKLRVQVPYQTIYAEAKLIAIPVDNKVNFEIQVYNFGVYAIYVSADIEIFKGEQKVDMLETDQILISSMKEGKLSATSVLEPGEYRAVAYVHYDGKTIELEQSFTIGKKIIEIQDITVDDFKPGNVAKITLMLKNQWPEPIQDVHGEIIIVRDNRHIETITTETFTIVDTKELIAYWNTKDMELGSYDAKANIIYVDQVTSRDFKIEIKETAEEVTIEEKPRRWLWIIIIILLILLVEFILCWKYADRVPPCHKLKERIRSLLKYMKRICKDYLDLVVIWWKKKRGKL